MNAKFSPDGSWLAFTSNEKDENRLEVYIARLTKEARVVGKPMQVSQGGGYDPSWQSSAELSYLDVNGTLRRLTIPQTVRDEKDFQTAERLFESGIPTLAASRNNYDVTDGGRRALFALPATETALPFRVVLNWYGLLTPSGSGAR
jgi:hypothetical protein